MSKNDKATNTMPNTTMSQNAGSMLEMQKQMEAMRKEMAHYTAQEVKGTLDYALKLESPDTEFRTPNSNYLIARLASAQFQTLRDELISAYMRNEAVQEDKTILLRRKESGEFRSDVEAAAAERSLDYYRMLEERLEEVISLISSVRAVYDKAVADQHAEDDARQQDTPSNERNYTNMPSLRWVSNEVKTNHPHDWETVNDMDRLTNQAEFWLRYNS